MVPSPPVPALAPAPASDPDSNTSPNPTDAPATIQQSQRSTRWHKPRDWPAFPLAARVATALSLLGLTVGLIIGLRIHDFRRKDFPYRPNSFDWAGFAQFHPVHPDSLYQIPSGPAVALPRVQHNFQSSTGGRAGGAAQRRKVLQSRAEAVKSAAQKTWSSYTKHAMPHDSLTPLTLTYSDTYGGWGAMMVDGLDTLWIMGLREEFYRAVRAVAQVDWANERFLSLNVFETTIRYLGGLLSAYDLSNLPVLLRKAVDLADMLMVAFDTPNRMPPFFLVYEAARAGTQVAGAQQSSASATSLGLEFTRLAQITGEAKYYDAAHRVTLFLAATQNMTLLPGVWPVKLDFQNMTDAEGTQFSLGAGADSLYEYLIKIHVLLGGREPLYANMWRRAADTASTHLLFSPMLPPEGRAASSSRFRPSVFPIPDPSNILLLGSANVSFRGDIPKLDPVVQHLGCFVGGMYALGGRILDVPRHVDIAAKLTRGCVWLYFVSTFGVMPEAATVAPCLMKSGINVVGDSTTAADAIAAAEGDKDRFKEYCAFNRTTAAFYASLGADPTLNVSATASPADSEALSQLPWPYVSCADCTYTLRPEAIESLFILYRVTGDPVWQDMAWDMWVAVRDVATTRSNDADGNGNGKPVEIFAAVDDVFGRLGTSSPTNSNNQTPTIKWKDDPIESFWLAETLKYFYLIFSPPDLISLDDWVFSTEAHPLKRSK